MKWNISVIRGKEIKKDLLSSGERKIIKWKILFIGAEGFGKTTKEGESPVTIRWILIIKVEWYTCYVVWRE